MGLDVSDAAKREMATVARGLGSEPGHFAPRGGCSEARVHVHRARGWRICVDQADEGRAANWHTRAPHSAVAAPVS